MNSDQLMKIVEQYSQNNNAGFSDIKVIRIPDQKTTFVEQSSDGRTNGDDVRLQGR
jgi:hypothetical protein